MTPPGPSLRRFALSSLPSEPWRNGAGSTRVVASLFDGDQLQWRISVADVVGDQAFSSFAGLDRTAALINGNGIDLVDGPTCLRMRSLGDTASFPGERMPRPELVDGPVQLWNVMTRRGRFDARVWLNNNRLDSDELLPRPDDTLIAVLVLGGRYRLEMNDHDTAREPAFTLQTGEGVLIEPGRAVTLIPDGAEAAALVTWILALANPER